MGVTKICKQCGKSFTVIKCREHTAKFCCKECAAAALKAPNDTVCDFCGKSFHMKKCQKERYQRNMGTFCSRRCLNEYRKVWFIGDNNHQSGLKGHLNPSFKGVEIPKKNHNNIDIFIYEPSHPYANKDGRVLKHRLVVEQNYELFDKSFFERINGWVVLKKEVIVHHIDKNHSNNDIFNLDVLYRGEHTRLHNKDRIIIKGKLGRITGVLKRGELLGNRTDSDNQQPSLNGNVFEGSTTNSRV